MFGSDVDVLCWFTNPLTRKTVANCCEDQGQAISDGVHLAWLAVVTGPSSAVFKLNKTGLTSAVAVLAAVRSITAREWLSTSEAADVLSVLGSATGLG